MQVLFTSISQHFDGQEHNEIDGTYILKLHDRGAIINYSISITPERDASHTKQRQ